MKHESMTVDLLVHQDESFLWNLQHVNRAPNDMVQMLLVSQEGPLCSAHHLQRMPKAKRSIHHS